jgi:hypothetical protein
MTNTQVPHPELDRKFQSINKKEVAHCSDIFKTRKCLFGKDNPYDGIFRKSFLTLSCNCEYHIQCLAKII